MSWLRRAGVRSLWGVFFLLALLPRRARAEDRFLLIWDSSTTPEAAQEALARLQAPPWKDFIYLKEGYPRIEESSKIPGLRPGNWVVTMGACTTAEEGAARTDMMRITGKALGLPVKAYVRKIQDARPLFCPDIMTMKHLTQIDFDTGSPRHKIMIFHPPWDDWRPPPKASPYGPTVVVLMVDGKPMDARLMPLNPDFVRCMYSDLCSLILISDPKHPTQYGALLRDEGGPGTEDVSCKKYNEQEERSRETDPAQERHYLDPPNVYEPFALARLLVTWDDKRLVKIQRKELGVKCCLTLEETSREPLKKDDE